MFASWSLRSSVSATPGVETTGTRNPAHYIVRGRVRRWRSAGNCDGFRVPMDAEVEITQARHDLLMRNLQARNLAKSQYYPTYRYGKLLGPTTTSDGPARDPEPRHDSSVRRERRPREQPPTRVDETRPGRGAAGDRCSRLHRPRTSLPSRRERCRPACDGRRCEIFRPVRGRRHH
jgi:hypothetical protein